ncbi:MAG: asparagine synthetase B family protein [Solirubrobacteraceae bacterium]
MSRWLAGVFDPGGRTDAYRLAGALAPGDASVLDCAPLQLAYSGPEPLPTEPLCLLDGHLDNAAEILRELDGARTRPARVSPGVGALPESARTDMAPKSPEELLAAAYRRWGHELLPRLRGDFVLLIWDRERGEGLLARDQLGVRPCFLHDAGGRLYFASEIRHLLALLPRRPAPDPAGVAHWVAVSSRPGPQTLYAGIRRLAPGTALLLGRRGVREQRYWAPRFEEPLDLPEPQLAGRIREALELAVARRIDVEGLTGVLMSGGLDSSSVAALCAQQGDGRVYACSGTFPAHPAADESELIETLSGTLALPGIRAEVRPGGLLASALESLAAWQMPLLGWGDFWTLALMRAAAAAGVRVMLDGDGGDELFGPRVYLLADRLRAGHPGQALALAYQLPGAISRPPLRQVAEVLRSLALAGALPYGPHNALRTPFARREVPGWLRPRAASDLLESDDPLAWKRLEGPRWWAHAAHGVTQGIEEAGVFEHQRRRAALAGVEARHPLLDLDLVQLGLRQPPRATLDPRFNRPVLRASMAGLLPDTVRLRAGKARFESLVVDCLSGPDWTAVRDLLSDRRSELGAYVKWEALREDLLDTDVRLRNDPFRWMWQVWRLSTAECWLRAQEHPVDDVLPPGAAASPPHIAIRSASPSYVFPP